MKKLITLLFVTFSFSAISQEKFNGLNMNMGNLYRLSDAKTRSISPENFTGEKGKGGMADTSDSSIIKPQLSTIQTPKMAFVIDWLDTMGGAETMLLVLHEMYPEAPIYTSVYDKKRMTLMGSRSTTSSRCRPAPTTN